MFAVAEEVNALRWTTKAEAAGLTIREETRGEKRDAVLSALMVKEEAIAIEYYIWVDSRLSYASYGAG